MARVLPPTGTQRRWSFNRGAVRLEADGSAGLLNPRPSPWISNDVVDGGGASTQDVCRAGNKRVSPSQATIRKGLHYRRLRAPWHLRQLTAVRLATSRRLCDLFHQHPYFPHRTCASQRSGLTRPATAVVIFDFRPRRPVALAANLDDFRIACSGRPSPDTRSSDRAGAGDMGPGIL
jgi:hypothetical protein